jgi:hypothetical protein
MAARRSVRTLVVKPADLAGVAQLAVLVHADEERAEVDGLAGAARPAADHQFLLGSDLDLLPRHRALPGQVGRATVLGHDPFETARLGRLEQGGSVSGDVLAEPDARIAAHDLPEKPTTDLKRLIQEGSAVEVEEVEHLVQERCGAIVRPTPLILAWRSAKSGSPWSSSAITSPSTMACRADIHVAGSRNGPK